MSAHCFFQSQTAVLAIDVCFIKSQEGPTKVLLERGSEVRA